MTTPASRIHDYLPRHRDPPATRLFQLESSLIRLFRYVDHTTLPPDLIAHLFTISPRVKEALSPIPPESPTP